MPDAPPAFLHVHSAPRAHCGCANAAGSAELGTDRGSQEARAAQGTSAVRYNCDKRQKAKANMARLRRQCIKAKECSDLSFKPVSVSPAGLVVPTGPDFCYCYYHYYCCCCLAVYMNGPSTKTQRTTYRRRNKPRRDIRGDSRDFF